MNEMEVSRRGARSGVALTWFSAAMTVGMVFVAASIVAAGLPWWLCLAATLAVFRGMVATREVYLRADREQVGVRPSMKRVGQILTWAVLLLLFVPGLLLPLLRSIFTGDAGS